MCTLIIQAVFVLPFQGDRAISVVAASIVCTLFSNYKTKMPQLPCSKETRNGVNDLRQFCCINERRCQPNHFEEAANLQVYTNFNRYWIHLHSDSTVGPFIIRDMHKRQQRHAGMPKWLSHASSSAGRATTNMRAWTNVWVSVYICVYANGELSWGILQACLCSSEAEVMSESVFPQSEMYVRMCVCRIGGQRWRTAEKIRPSTLNKTNYSQRSEKKKIQARYSLQKTGFFFTPCLRKHSWYHSYEVLFS